MHITSFTRYKTIGNKVYAYEVTAYYDKVRKRPAQKSRYLGQLDALTGTITRPGKIRTTHEKMILDFGDSYFVTKYMEKNMSDVYDFASKSGVLPLILFKTIRKASMRRAEIWHDGNVAKYIAPSDLTSQRISEFLMKFGDESNLRLFYKKYLHPPESGVSIDTTALPNQIDLDSTQWGYSSETVDEEIKLLLVMDRERNRPLYFRYIPGSILDVSTLETTNTEMEKIGIRSSLTIMDAGFFSEDNIRSMFKGKMDFLIRVPANRSIYHECIESSRDIEDPERAVKYGKRIMFILSSRKTFADHDVFIYTILDPERRGRELRRYLLKHQKDYDRFSVKRKGFMVLMSSSEISLEELVPMYYTRQFVEKVFSHIKPHLEPFFSRSEGGTKGKPFPDCPRIHSCCNDS